MIKILLIRKLIEIIMQSDLQQLIPPVHLLLGSGASIILRKINQDYFHETLYDLQILFCSKNRKILIISIFHIWSF